MGAINVDYSATHKYFLIDLLVPELREEIQTIPKIEYWFGEKQQHARYGLPADGLPSLLEFLGKYKDYVEVSDEAIARFPDPAGFRPDAKIVLQDRIKSLEEELTKLKGQAVTEGLPTEGAQGEEGAAPEDPSPPKRGPGRPKGS